MEDGCNSSWWECPLACHTGSEVARVAFCNSAASVANEQETRWETFVEKALEKQCLGLS